MVAKQNFCPAGEELESRSLLNVGTSEIGSFLGIESLRDAEHRAMAQQRVHVRRLPKYTEHASKMVLSWPTFNWQVPLGLQSAVGLSFHPHSIVVQTRGVTGRVTSPHAHGIDPAQAPIIVPNAGLPAGALAAFNRH